MSSEKFAFNVFSRLSNPNREPKLGRSYRRVLGAVVGRVGACCVVVIVAMVEEVIVGGDIGRGPTKVGVCVVCIVSCVALADSGSFPSLRLLDLRSSPAKGSSSLSASSSRRLFNITRYYYDYFCFLGSDLIWLPGSLRLFLSSDSVVRDVSSDDGPHDRPVVFPELELSAAVRSDDDVSLDTSGGNSTFSGRYYYDYFCFLGSDLIWLPGSLRLFLSSDSVVRDVSSDDGPHDRPVVFPELELSAAVRSDDDVSLDTSGGNSTFSGV
nr:hypothetical protein [Tanacetum cinerariifolium]